MARKKVNLVWIANDSTRRATLKKRRKGLMKKAQELSTLCDVKACVVVYGEGEAEPEVWPSAAGAAAVLRRFRAMPELEQCKKMMDQEGFLRQRVAKLQEQLHKSQRENRERETALLLHDAIAGRRPGLEGLTIEEVTSLGWMVEMRLKSVTDRLAQLRAAGHNLAGLPSAPAPATSFQPHLPVLPAYAAGNMNTKAPAVNRPAAAANQQHGWHMMDVAASTGGDLGAVVYSGFSAAAAGGMLQHSNLQDPAGFAWPDPRVSFPPCM